METHPDDLPPKVQSSAAANPALSFLVECRTVLFAGFFVFSFDIPLESC